MLGASFCGNVSGKCCRKQNLIITEISNKDRFDFVNSKREAFAKSICWRGICEREHMLSCCAVFFVHLTIVCSYFLHFRFKRRKIHILLTETVSDCLFRNCPLRSLLHKSISKKKRKRKRKRIETSPDLPRLVERGSIFVPILFMRCHRFFFRWRK